MQRGKGRRERVRGDEREEREGERERKRGTKGQHIEKQTL